MDKISITISLSCNFEFTLLVMHEKIKYRMLALDQKAQRMQVQIHYLELEHGNFVLHGVAKLVQQTANRVALQLNPTPAKRYCFHLNESYGYTN